MPGNIGPLSEEKAQKSSHSLGLDFSSKLAQILQAVSVKFLDQMCPGPMIDKCKLRPLFRAKVFKS
jgi:hypothetical protein